MKKEILSIITDLPRNSDIFVFGSWLKNSKFSDIDVLVVYDNRFCSPDKAYEEIQPVINKIQNAIGFRIDLTLLSKEEERSVEFIKKAECQKFRNVVDNLDKMNPWDTIPNSYA